MKKKFNYHQLGIVVFSGITLIAGCDDEKSSATDETGENATMDPVDTDDVPDPTNGEAGDGGETCDIRCSPGLQNCPSPEEKCSPFLCGEGCCTDATHCVPKTAAPKKFGEPCVRDLAEGNDDCDAQLFCMPDGGTTGTSGPGKCEQLCITEQEGTPNHCQELGLAANYRCFNFNDGTYPVCMPKCDPINPQCPVEGESCYLAIDDYTCFKFAPTPISPGNYGDPCDTEQGCKAGMACAPPTLLPNCGATCTGSAVCGCCAPFCDLNAENPEEKCQLEEEKCLPVYNPPPPGREHVGICALEK